MEKDSTAAVTCEGRNRRTFRTAIDCVPSLRSDELDVARTIFRPVVYVTAARAVATVLKNGAQPTKRDMLYYGSPIFRMTTRRHFWRLRAN